MFNWVVFIFSGILIVSEIVICVIRLRKEKKQERDTLTSLRKFVEYEVLNMTLRNPVTNEQATDYVLGRAFLRIEFPESKSWIAYLFNLDECITIGRSRENKICIRDERLSRTHCKIYVTNGYMWLQDLGTANGTVLKKGLFRKVCLAPQETTSLEHGDVIVVGKHKMRVKIYYGHQAMN